VTVLLEYLDLALDVRSWVSPHNSLAFTQILLFNCKEFLYWLLQLHTDFQLTTLNGWLGGLFIHKFNRVILTPVGPIFFGPTSDLEFFPNFMNLPVLLLYGNSHYLGWNKQLLSVSLRECCDRRFCSHYKQYLIEARFWLAITKVGSEGMITCKNRVSALWN